MEGPDSSDSWDTVCLGVLYKNILSEVYFLSPDGTSLAAPDGRAANTDAFAWGCRRYLHGVTTAWVAGIEPR